MNSMIESVIAVTVTYNDVDFLLREIEYLEKQTYKVKKIVIVDNASNEECKEKLKKIENNKNKITMSDNSKI